MKFNSLPFLLSLLLLTSCAKIIPPDGGDKDISPPEVLRMLPSNGSTSFSAAEFYIEFDEYVQLSNIYNQLVVSPPLSEKPEIRIKRKAVYVKLKESLKSNTTYTFNFGDGVVDLNEANPAKDLVYVLATGAELDTLAIQGQVLDAFTASPVEGVKVMVYESMEDSLPLKEKPFYFAKTGSDGYFKIANMRAGAYKLFALEEQNNNYLFDDPASERIAYLDFPVSPSVLDSTAISYTLNLSAEEAIIQYIQDYRIDSSGFAALKFFSNARDVQIVPLAGVPEDVKYELYLPTDTMYVWWAGDPFVGEIDLELRQRDEVIDTLILPINYGMSGQLLLPTALPKKRALDSTLTLRWNRPISKLDTLKWTLQLDSLFTDFEVSKGPDAFSTTLKTIFKGGETYRLEILPGGVTSRESWKNDTLNYTFETYPNKHYGKVNLSLKAPMTTGQWIVRLIDQKGKVYRETPVDSVAKIHFDSLLPDQYILQLLDDRNRNGEWDPVNYLEGRQPEKIYPFQDALNVRSNWEMDLDWEIKAPKSNF